LAKTKKGRQHRNLRRWLSFFIAVIAGLLLFVAGVHGSIGILMFAFDEISSLLPELINVIKITLVLLTVIASSGGLRSSLADTLF
jgi:uncharacterized membrane protein